MGLQLNCIKKNYLIYLSTLVGLQIVFTVASTAGILGLLDQNEGTIGSTDATAQLHTAARVGQALLWVDCVVLVYSLLVLLMKVCAGTAVFNEVATFGINVALFVVFLIMCVLWGVYDTFDQALSVRGSHLVVWMLLLLLTINFLAMSLVDFCALYWQEVKEKIPDMPKTPTIKAPKFKMPKKPKFMRKKKKEGAEELAEGGEGVGKVHVVSEVPNRSASVTESLADKLAGTIEQALEKAIENIAAKQAPAEPVVAVEVEAPEVAICDATAPEPVVVVEAEPVAVAVEAEAEVPAVASVEVAAPAVEVEVKAEEVVQAAAAEPSETEVKGAAE